MTSSYGDENASCPTTTALPFADFVVPLGEEEGGGVAKETLESPLTRLMLADVLVVFSKCTTAGIDTSFGERVVLRSSPPCESDLSRANGLTLCGSERRRMDARELSISLMAQKIKKN
jgi:hypothetical protein